MSEIKPSRSPKTRARYGVGVEYALHCLLYLVPAEGASPPPIGVGDLATFQGVSETYLAKIFLRLKKADIVRSTPGLKGGYELARPADQISFWDIATAVEGHSPLFICNQIRANCALFDRNGGTMPTPTTALRGTCAIHAVMLEAEKHLREVLESKSLGWLHKSLDRVLSTEQRAETSHWFQKALEQRS